LHEINAPFGKRADGNKMMQHSRVGACLVLKNLAGWALFDGLNTILED
jgi:hypothetical protein